MTSQKETREAIKEAKATAFVTSRSKYFMAASFPMCQDRFHFFQNRVVAENVIANTQKPWTLKAPVILMEKRLSIGHGRENKE